MAQQEFGDRHKHEISNPQNFYIPITERAKLINKLRSTLERSFITDGDVFEAIADTFATTGRQNKKANYLEVRKNRAHKTPDWKGQGVAEIEDYDTCETILLGYERKSPNEKSDRREAAWVEFYEGEDLDRDPYLSINLNRNQDGAIGVSIFENGEEELETKNYLMPDAERKKILGAFLKGTKLENYSIEFSRIYQN